MYEEKMGLFNGSHVCSSNPWTFLFHFSKSIIKRGLVMADS